MPCLRYSLHHKDTFYGQSTGFVSQVLLMLVGFWAEPTARLSPHLVVRECLKVEVVCFTLWALICNLNNDRDLVWPSDAPVAPIPGGHALDLKALPAAHTACWLGAVLPGDKRLQTWYCLPAFFDRLTTATACQARAPCLY